MFGVHPSGLSWILLFSVACRPYAEVKGQDGEDGSTSILEESWGFGMWPLEGSYSRLGKNKTESSHVIEMGVPEEVDSRHHRYHRHQRHLAELQHKDSCPLLERENREREREDHAFWEKRCETKVIFCLSRRGIQLSFCGSMVPNEFDSDYGLKFNRFLRACLVS